MPIQKSGAIGPEAICGIFIDDAVGLLGGDSWLMR